MIRLAIKTLVFALTAVLLCTGGYLGLMQLTGNFHEVIAGELYRSGQPTEDRIRRYHDTAGIRTIINLRGENAGMRWYDTEVAVSRDLNIDHIDFAMSASTILDATRREELAQIMETAKKPILIHCQSGADRTGLVTALYLARIKGVDVEDAEEQLTLQYGHLGIPHYSMSFAMDISWEDIEAWLGHDEGLE